jgi:hypothetical protein
MPKPTVYLDSTIPSVYHDQRTDPERVRWRRITRAWWETADELYTLVSSPLMVSEVIAGRKNRQSLARFELVRSIALVELTGEIDAIARFYIQNKLMPEDDAAHVAAASYYAVDILLSWNFKHMVNINKRIHLHRLNTRLGLHIPRICSPKDLLGAP